jgi:hypothetical protein
MADLASAVVIEEHGVAGFEFIPKSTLKVLANHRSRVAWRLHAYLAPKLAAQ